MKKRFFDNPDDETLAMTTNYLCNEWLDDADRKVFETMKRNNPRRYRVAVYFLLLPLFVGVGHFKRAFLDFPMLRNPQTPSRLCGPGLRHILAVERPLSGLQGKPRQQEKQDNRPMVYRDEIFHPLHRFHRNSTGQYPPIRKSPQSCRSRYALAALQEVC